MGFENLHLGATGAGGPTIPDDEIDRVILAGVRTLGIEPHPDDQGLLASALLWPLRRVLRDTGWAGALLVLGLVYARGTPRGGLLGSSAADDAEPEYGLRLVPNENATAPEGAPEGEQ